MTITYDSEQKLLYSQGVGEYFYNGCENIDALAVILFNLKHEKLSLQEAWLQIKASELIEITPKGKNMTVNIDTSQFIELLDKIQEG